MALRFDFSFYSVMFEDKKKYDVRFIHIPYTHKNKSRALCVKKTPFFMGGDHRTHTGFNIDGRTARPHRAQRTSQGHVNDDI